MTNKCHTINNEWPITFPDIRNCSYGTYRVLCRCNFLAGLEMLASRGSGGYLELWEVDLFRKITLIMNDLIFEDVTGSACSVLFYIDWTLWD